MKIAELRTNPILGDYFWAKAKENSRSILDDMVLETLWERYITSQINSDQVLDVLEKKRNKHLLK